MKPFDNDLISGSVLRSVLKLSIPVIGLNLVNGVHGLVDHILVGHYLDSNANAGIGVAWQVFLVIVVFIASLFHGMNVLVARYAGRQDRTNLSHVVYHTFLASVSVLLLVVAPLGYVISPYLLTVANAPSEVQVYALPYLRIMFTSGAPLFLMFMMTGAMQASGDAHTPFFLGILTTIFNVVISATLITGFGPFPQLGAAGAAVGTCLGPLPSVLIVLSLVTRRRLIIQLPPRLTLRPDLAVLRVVTRIGVPTGTQAVLLNIGGVLLLRYIGSLEYAGEAQAAYVICYSQLFAIVSWASFGLRSASATLMGQNLGAGQPERAKASVGVAAAMGGIWATVWGVVYWFFPHGLLAIFDVTDPIVLAFGRDLLKYLAFSGIFLATALALTGALQGAGDTKRPMYIAFITQIVIVLGLCELFRQLGTLQAQHIWLAILVGHAARVLLTYLVFQQGRWAHITIELQEKRL
jgi:putative MATE family efflux protein